MRITQTKFHDFSMKMSFFTFLDFPMHGIFIGLNSRFSRWVGTLYFVENDINLLLDSEQMAAILDFFTHNAMSKIFSTTPQCPVYLTTPWWTPKTRICVYYVENDINLLFDLEQMAAILDFLPTIQYLKYFPTTPQCPAYLKTPW